MKTNRVWMALLGMAVVLGARSGTAADAGSRAKQGLTGVVVHVRQDNVLVAELGRAERTAVGVFASIGVSVAFRSGGGSKSPGEGAMIIELQLDARTPAQFHPGAMAYAMPFGSSGIRIHIFCDRVRKAWPDGGTGIVLGNVMAHEIGHVLEGVVRHSEEGVMKARWENGDYRQMISGTIAFDPTDVELIHAALETRATRLAGAVPPPR